MKIHIEVSGVITRLFLLGNKQRKEKGEKKAFLTVSEMRSLEITSEMNVMLEKGAKQIALSAGLHPGFTLGVMICCV